MKKSIILVFTVFVGILALTGCGGKEDTALQTEASLVNESEKEVTITTTVNGKYFTEPTRHGVVAENGSNGEKSILKSTANEIDFYNALLEIGAVPGNNLTMDDMTKGVKVEGTPLDVSVTWEGLDKWIPFSDIVKSSETRPMEILYGGNLENAKDKKTGCILCLDSCAVGITSNSSYETGASSSIQFYGDDSVLPSDGTKVIVKFSLAE